MAHFIVTYFDCGIFLQSSHPSNCGLNCDFLRPLLRDGPQLKGHKNFVQFVRGCKFVADIGSHIFLSVTVVKDAITVYHVKTVIEKS